MKNKAFTLAEVLITLVIIGVIAALTIPSLLNNINDNEKRLLLKKFTLL
ncbi:MAG: prepilin-type N-terminal cleavage/methylation domain-containing protein [Candidatus Gastranaerophilales bacterium]|nr:prepilin-type N-terminal cleavage/methylation domain-containing protein [Candidatus Gastranaerophilales bacterium]